MSELAFNRILLEKNNQTLAILSLVSLTMNLVMAVMLILTVQKPPLVVYDDTQEISSLRLKRYRVEEETIKNFTAMVVKDYLNFNAASLTIQIDGIAPYLASKPLNSILESYKRNQSKMEKENISQEFVVGEMRITKKSNPFWIEVEGMRIITADGNKKNDSLTYIFEIEKVKPTQNNPYGLRVLDVVEKKENEEKSK